MRKIQVAVFMIFLIACQPSVDVPLTATSTARPTKTPIMPTVTTTPFPPLSEEGPYLMMLQGYGTETQQLVIYNQDGSGKKVIELPEGGQIPGPYRLNAVVSPDGNWLAFYKGEVENSEKFPVSLYILNVKNGSIKKIADVVADDYLNRLEKLSNQLKELNPDYYKPTEDRDWVSGEITSMFRLWIRSVAWSPDSKHLAFAGQIDGLSSDVYVYNIEIESIQRAEDTLQSIQWIAWSPDGNHIVFINSLPGNVYTGAELYSISISKFMIQKPISLISDTWLYIGDWLSNTKILAARGLHGVGATTLQAIDIATGNSSPLWLDGFTSFAVDYKNQSVFLNASEYGEPENFGVYEISFSGERRKIIDGLYYVDLFLRDGEKHRLLISGSDGYKAEIKLHRDVVGVNEKNELTFLGKFDSAKISISPDKLWLTMYDDMVYENSKLYLFDINDDLKSTFQISGINDFLWTPDSKYLYLSSVKSLYYLDIESGLIKLVDQCMLENCGFSLDDGFSVWLP